MALIPRYHTAVGMYAIDPSDLTSLNAGTTTVEIHQGMVVGVNSSGYIKKASGTGTGGIRPIGLAGDSFATASAHTAYSSSLVINPAGSKKATQNRVSDYFNETLGSGMMTVYFGSGEFYTNMYESANVSGGSAQTWTTGSALYSSVAASTTYGYVSPSSSVVGSLTPVQIGVITSYPVLAPFPSGVPGVEGGLAGSTIGTDYSLPLGPAGDANTVNGVSNFIGFILSV